MTWEVRRADCVEAMAAMDEASIDAIVCDPPYGLEFMGRAWDRLAPEDEGERGYRTTGAVPQSGRRPVSDQAGAHDEGYRNLRGKERLMQDWHERWAKEALRVLKPGGHLLAFGGTRTYHRLACAVEDAGFEIRDEILSVFEATDAGRRFLASLTPEQLAALDKLDGGPLAWSYGSGFPKSLNVGKAIDKAAGVEREVVGRRTDGRYAYGFEGTANRPTGGAAGAEDAERIGGFVGSKGEITAPSTPEARQWEDWGTALKPAHEPIVVARKPLSGTVAENILANGTGALNIGGCRIHTEGSEGSAYTVKRLKPGATLSKTGGNWRPEDDEELPWEAGREYQGQTKDGRWPANVVLSHSSECVLVGTRQVKGDPRATGTGQRQGGFYDVGAGSGDGEPNAPVYGDTEVEVWACVPGCPVRMLDDQSGELHSQDPVTRNGGRKPGWSPSGTDRPMLDKANPNGGDRGGASRFFYCAKSSSTERNAGLGRLAKHEAYTHNIDGRDPTRPSNAMGAGERARVERGESGIAPRANNHPTVKPIDLMRWLVRLVTPPGGLVLDPFAGSGTTGCAAVLEGFDFVGIEREAAYVPIAEARIRFWASHPTDLPIEAALASERIANKIADAGQLTLGDL